MIRWLFVVGLVVWTAGCAADAPENTEGRASGVAAAAPEAVGTAVHDSILTVVQEFLRAMTANDVGASRAVLLPGGIGMGATQTPQGLLMHHESNEEYLEWLSGHTGTLVERIWDPVILVHGPIGNLWSPFDFYRNGEFSHCGVNNVSLIRTDDGWRIANWIWTEETEGCPSSPIGPLGGG